MDVRHFHKNCTSTPCRLTDDVAATDNDRLLSVVLLYDQPCDARALDEALFSLAIQDHTPLEVVVVLPACGKSLPRRIERPRNSRAGAAIEHSLAVATKHN